VSNEEGRASGKKEKEKDQQRPGPKKNPNQGFESVSYHRKTPFR